MVVNCFRRDRRKQRNHSGVLFREHRRATLGDNPSDSKRCFRQPCNCNGDSKWRHHIKYSDKREPGFRCTLGSFPERDGCMDGEQSLPRYWRLHWRLQRFCRPSERNERQLRELSCDGEHEAKEFEPNFRLGWSCFQQWLGHHAPVGRATVILHYSESRW